MGIFDFLTPKADGFAYDPMRLPAGADPENDPVVGYDELGQKIRRSRFDGTQYLFEMTPPKTQSVVKGAYREATANPLGFTGDLLSNAVQSAWDAISVPARSMAGEPITYGDIAGLTGMVTLGAGAATAPAGALRMGAAREGRAPVTFADAERAMQETPGIRAYHTTEQPFEAYDWSRLGVATGYNTAGISEENWAVNLAKIGPWAHETPLSSKMGGVDLPIDISGKAKKFKSLDALERSVVKAGGPEKFRNKLISEGFGHIRVVDEEFKGTSFVGLSPESFVVNAARAK